MATVEGVLQTNSSVVSPVVNRESAESALEAYADALECAPTIFNRAPYIKFQLPFWSAVYSKFESAIAETAEAFARRRLEDNKANSQQKFSVEPKFAVSSSKLSFPLGFTMGKRENLEEGSSQMLQSRLDLLASELGPHHCYQYGQFYCFHLKLVVSAWHRQYNLDDQDFEKTDWDAQETITPDVPFDELLKAVLLYASFDFSNTAYDYGEAMLEFRPFVLEKDASSGGPSSRTDYYRISALDLWSGDCHAAEVHADLTRTAGGMAGAGGKSLAERLFAAERSGAMLEELPKEGNSPIVIREIRHDHHGGKIIYYPFWQIPITCHRSAEFSQRLKYQKTSRVGLIFKKTATEEAEYSVLHRFPFAASGFASVDALSGAFQDATALEVVPNADDPASTAVEYSVDTIDQSS